MDLLLRMLMPYAFIVGVGAGYRLMDIWLERRKTRPPKVLYRWKD